MTLGDMKELKARFIVVTELMGDDYGDTQAYQDACHDLDTLIICIAEDITKHREQKRHTDES